jgi:hypothetical protein
MELFRNGLPDAALLDLAEDVVDWSSVSGIAMATAGFFLSAPLPFFVDITPTIHFFELARGQCGFLPRATAPGNGGILQRKKTSRLDLFDPLTNVSGEQATESCCVTLSGQA